MLWLDSLAVLVQSGYASWTRKGKGPRCSPEQNRDAVEHWPLGSVCMWLLARSYVSVGLLRAVCTELTGNFGGLPGRRLTAWGCTARTTEHCEQVRLLAHHERCNNGGRLVHNRP